MSNNLFNSKNLWIDAETAWLLGIDSQESVYINGDIVYVNHFYPDNIEFAIPLFALRAEKIYNLLSTHSPDIVDFKVFSNFKENISRMFSDNYESMELLAESNRILEERKEMDEMKRVEIFFENNELTSKKILESSSKKIKKIVDKRTVLENKVLELENQLKKELFKNINSAKLVSNSEDTDNTSKKHKSKKQKKDKTEAQLNQNNEELIEPSPETPEEQLDKNETVLNMNVEEEVISETNLVDDLKEYETQSIDDVDRSFYNRQCLKLEKSINKYNKKINKIHNDISSIIGKKVKTHDDFRSIYNNVSARLEMTREKAQVARKTSNIEFNKVKPYIVAELHSLIFICYKSMCEGKVIFDKSVEMFAKLILLIKRNLSMFDNAKE